MLSGAGVSLGIEACAQVACSTKSAIPLVQTLSIALPFFKPPKHRMRQFIRLLRYLALRTLRGPPAVLDGVQCSSQKPPPR